MRKRPFLAIFEFKMAFFAHSDKDCANAREQVEHSKLNRKFLYYFTIFAIIIEILIKKDWRMCARFARLERRTYALGVSAASRRVSHGNEKFGRFCSLAARAIKLFVAVRHSPTRCWHA